jgi:hypothetical protein
MAHSEWDYQRAEHSNPQEHSWASPLANYWVVVHLLTVELDKWAAKSLAVQG